MIKRKLFTLCLILKEDEVLLQCRKHAPFAGKWNAPGGKVEENENIKEACVREVYEETGLTILSPNLICTINFEQGDTLIKIFVFCSRYFLGTLRSSEEGELAWFSIHSLSNIKQNLAFGIDWLLNIAVEVKNQPIELVF
ncbi:8-oxo-dGTP diphosphatase [Desulfofundulus thermocisternus]|uniref:8-oxo-dGTP diphosphatase n=1 Tax=Desulfofundulus thermocisternus TaxID=42471 RepID=UPI00217D2F35|nr:8-oxo-dGTP diphosphatase [Desulfofundulus thermocisternus]MCS5697336.1 8-oxo-dGTP diphosphatase [Desulfofundulus thermocisternus]